MNMAAERQLRAFVRANRNRVLFRKFLVGSSVFLLLVVVGLITLWLTNRSLLLAQWQHPNLLALVDVFVRVPALLLLLVLPIFCLFLIANISVKPLAIWLYLRDAREEQKLYRKLYTSLMALLDTYETPMIVSQGSEADQGQDVQKIIHKQGKHLMLLGLPGAGKTITLRVYQHDAFKRLRKLIWSTDKIPVYVQMKDYNAFLKKAEENLTFRNYLIHKGALAGIHHIRPHLDKLIQQGRILLLCDGLNEVDNSYLPTVCEELRQLMRETNIRLVITCREVDYHAQPVFQTLVGEQYAREFLISPLKLEQMREFVEKYILAGYVDEHSGIWQYTVDDIMGVIEKSRLSKHCTNPLMLYTLMKTINGTSLESSLELDTRGRLLGEFVSQLIRSELQKRSGRRNLPNEKDLVLFLSEFACTARRTKDRNAVQLLSLAAGSGGRAKRSIPFEELADSLHAWLDDPISDDPLTSLEELGLERAHDPYSKSEIVTYLDFAQSAALITISRDGIVSFRHEVVAEYFAAEYLYALDHKNHATPPFIEELLEDFGAWSQPIALWAGLLRDPMVLADRLSEYVHAPFDVKYKYNALALSLMCVGVVWAPPQAQATPTMTVPDNVLKALRICIPDPEARKHVAPVLKRCAEEGGIEVYRALLPTLSMSGPWLGELLLLIEDTQILSILFEYLEETIDKPAYAKHVEGVVKVLGKFRKEAVPRAIELSRPVFPRSLRIAAMDILGLTQTPGAVAPLIAYLGDSEQAIIEAVVGALVNLGPELTFEAVFRELGDVSVSRQVQWRALHVLKGFLEKEDATYALHSVMYQRIIEATLSVLSSAYPIEIGQVAKSMLLGQTQCVSNASARRTETVVSVLIQALSTDDEMMAANVVWLLKQIGKGATSLLLSQFYAKVPEIVQVRIIEVFRDAPDQTALPLLLQLVESSSQKVQDAVAQALPHYVPESIAGLIEIIQSAQQSTQGAWRAAHILMEIGEASVEEVIAALPLTSSNRVRLLVDVLVQVHHPKAIPALIDLLKGSQNDTQLGIYLVQALSHFKEKLVVQALLEVLETAQSELYAEISKELGQLGSVALDGLIAALDAEQGAAVIPGVRQALLSIKPFPAQALIAAFKQCSDVQAQQIKLLLWQKEVEVAPKIVTLLAVHNEDVSQYVTQTLDRMSEHVLVPSLLEVLSNSGAYSHIAKYLLKYPGCIPELVQRLGDPARHEAAHKVLLEFAARGINILPFLIAALDDQKTIAQVYAQRILETLVRRETKIIPQVLELFAPIYTLYKQRAAEALVGVLAKDLVDVSIPVLLEELGTENNYVREGIANVLVRVVREHEARQSIVLDALTEALQLNGHRKGAERALIGMGELAVEKVGELITEQQRGKSAQYILSQIGPPAFPVIWTAYSNTTNAEMRQAAQNIFRSMSTKDIKVDLVQLLTSNKRQDIEMSLTLLSERVHDEIAALPLLKQEMIPALLEGVQANSREDAKLRIVAFLLLQRKSVVIEHLVRVLNKYPGHAEWLIPAFLLLGKTGTEVSEALSKLLHDAMPSMLRADVMSMLGMLEANREVVAEAAAVGSVVQMEQQEISLRALGGLLAGGKWNVPILHTLRNASTPDSVEHELYSILLGQPYARRMVALRDELFAEKQSHEEDNRKSQEWIEGLDRTLKQVRTAKSNLESELNTAKYRTTELQGEKADLESTNAALKRQINQLRNENAVLESRLRNRR